MVTPSFSETDLEIALFGLTSALFGGFLAERGGSLGLSTAVFGQSIRGHSERYKQGELSYHMHELEASLIRVGRVEVREATATFWKIRLKLSCCQSSVMAVIPVGCLSQEINPICQPVSAAKEHGLSFLPLLNFMECRIGAGITLALVQGMKVLVSFPGVYFFYH